MILWHVCLATRVTDRLNCSGRGIRAERQVLGVLTRPIELAAEHQTAVRGLHGNHVGIQIGAATQ